jgi:hypothetical protein
LQQHLEAQSLYDDSDGAHSHTSTELELGMEVEMEMEGCTQIVNWNMEVEDEMEMDTAHSRISVEMGMKKCGCAYNAYNALRSTGRWSYRRRSPFACRWVLRMRMEMEVQRWVWRYVLHHPRSPPFLAVVEHGWFWL